MPITTSILRAASSARTTRTSNRVTFADDLIQFALTKLPLPRRAPPSTVVPSLPSVQLPVVTPRATKDRHERAERRERKRERKKERSRERERSGVRKAKGKERVKERNKHRKDPRVIVTRVDKSTKSAKKLRSHRHSLPTSTPIHTRKTSTPVVITQVAPASASATRSEVAASTTRSHKRHGGSHHKCRKHAHGKRREERRRQRAADREREKQREQEQELRRRARRERRRERDRRRAARDISHLPQPVTSSITAADVPVSTDSPLLQEEADVAREAMVAAKRDARINQILRAGALANVKHYVRAALRLNEMDDTYAWDMWDVVDARILYNIYLQCRERATVDLRTEAAIRLYELDLRRWMLQEHAEFKRLLRERAAAKEARFGAARQAADDKRDAKRKRHNLASFVADELGSDLTSVRKLPRAQLDHAVLAAVVARADRLNSCDGVRASYY